MAQQASSDAGGGDPGRIADPADFGRELTLARRRAGLTVRQAARASGIPVSTAGDYFAGRHLPPASQPELLPRLLGACGITDETAVGRWRDALARVRRAPGRRPTRGPAPYRGLASFQPEDAGWFFGREELALHLVRLATGVAAPGIPLAVVGPSGSGKSSLLRAGLVPRLRAASPARPGGRPVVLLTPGDAPLAALAGGLAPLTAPAGDPATVARVLRREPERYARMIGRDEQPPAIIVDQFEEAFAGVDEAGRREFVTALAALSGTTLVVLGLRADFYGHALRYPELARSLQERQIVVGPMSANQLRRAIVEPARKAGLDIEEGLVELLLTDMRPQAGPAQAGPAPDGGPGGAAPGEVPGGAAPGGGPGGAAGHEAGALPLLSHALLATWERSQGHRLTVAGYRASGGIRDAIASTAEVAYGTLAPEEREIARQLFLRLVHVTDDERETRARVPLRDLGEAAAAVLRRFVDERLVTLDMASAEITHEALLGAWPRLRSWIDANREDIRVRRFIATAARAWADAGRDAAALLRGGQLALARDWAAAPANRAALSPLAREFIDAGVAEEAAQQAAQRRRTRRLRQLAGLLTVLVLLTVGLAGYAFQQRQLATTAQSVAESRTVAVEADQVRADNPALAAQLSLAAYRIMPTSAALASLLESSGQPSAARFLDSGRIVQSVALSPRRHLLAVAAADGTLRLWDLSVPGRPAPVRTLAALGPGRPLYAAAFSPDGRLLAAAGADRRVRLWNVAGPGRPVPLGAPLTGPGSTVYSLAFGNGGRLLAAGGADKAVWLWDVTDPGHPAPAGGPLTGAANYVQAVAVSPAGTLLAAGGADGTVRLWDISDPARPRPVGKPLTGPAKVVDAVAFSPDGRTLAAGSYDHQVWRWRVANPARPRPLPPLTGATDWVNAVAYSPDGKVLAEGSADGRVLLFGAATGALLGVLPHPQPVTSLAWDGPGLLVTGDADGYVRAWHLPTPGLMTGSPVNSVAFAPGGGALAVGADDLQLWNPATHQMTASAPVPGAGAGNTVNAVAFAPAGNLIAAGYADGRLQLWRPGPHLVPLGRPVAATNRALPARAVEFAAFAPGGRVLATAADDGTVRLWDLTSPAGPRQLAAIPDSRTYVFSVSWRRDGRVLAAASADDRVQLWNVASPARPARLGRPLTGPTNTAYSVAFSPGGRILAVGSADRDVRLWNVADPARPHRAGPALAGPTGYVYSVAFAPRGHVLAAGNTDGTVWLWNLADPAHPSLIATLTGPTRHVYSVAFGPGGRTLAAADAAGMVWLWDTRARDASAGICAMAGQPISRAEWRTYVPGRRYAPPCPPR